MSWTRLHLRKQRNQCDRACDEHVRSSRVVIYILKMASSGLQNELDSVRRLLLAANCLIPFGDEFFQPVEDVIGLENGTVALLRKRADSHQMWRGLRGRQVGHYLGFRASDWSLVRQILGSRHSLRVAVSLFDPQVDSAMDVAAVLGPVNCSSRSSGGGIGRQTSQISATGNDSAHSTHR